MARYFLDSSALVKRYHAESGTAAVESLFNTPAHRLVISRLALVEVQSSFARLVRETANTAADFGALVARLEADVAAGILTVAGVSSRRLAEAATILNTHGLRRAVRTLAAIQLATAQALDGRTRIAAFVAADKKLLAIAADACGLPILDVS